MGGVGWPVLGGFGAQSTAHPSSPSSKLTCPPSNPPSHTRLCNSCTSQTHTQHTHTTDTPVPAPPLKQHPDREGEQEERAESSEGSKGREELFSPLRRHELARDHAPCGRRDQRSARERQLDPGGPCGGRVDWPLAQQERALRVCGRRTRRNVQQQQRALCFPPAPCRGRRRHRSDARDHDRRVLRAGARALARARARRGRPAVATRRQGLARVSARGRRSRRRQRPCVRPGRAPCGYARPLALVAQDVAVC
jgi:hypothetical protein